MPFIVAHTPLGQFKGRLFPQKDVPNVKNLIVDIQTSGGTFRMRGPSSDICFGKAVMENSVFIIDGVEHTE
jgi:hypothetical protein